MLMIFGIFSNMKGIWMIFSNRCSSRSKISISKEAINNKHPNVNHSQNPNTSSETIAGKSSCQYKSCVKTTKKPSLAWSGLHFLTVDVQSLAKFNSGAALHSFLHTCGQATTCEKTTWPNLAGNTIEMCMDCLHWLRLFMWLPKAFFLSHIATSTPIIISQMIISLWLRILRSNWKSLSELYRKIVMFLYGFLSFWSFLSFYSEKFFSKKNYINFTIFTLN